MADQFHKYRWLGFTGLFILSFSFFFFYYPYHLFFKEQTQLFLLTSDYFFSYFKQPAWLSSYLGDFLTQFFYLRGGGPFIIAFILCVEWLLGSLVIRKATQLSNSWLWALIPVVVDWGLHTLQMHRLAISVGVILVLLISLGYAQIRNQKIAWTVVFVFPFIGYWMLGSSMIIFPFLILLYNWKNGKGTILKVTAAIGILLVAVLIVNSFYLLTFRQMVLYPAISHRSLLLFSAWGAIVVGLLLLKEWTILNARLMNWLLPLFSLCSLIFGIYSLANFNFEKILALDTETYFGNPDRVIELSKQYSIKSRYTAYYTNIALAQKGELPERLLDFYQPFSEGLLLPVLPTETWQSILFSNEAFYLIGDMNLAQHSAMLGITFSPFQRGSRMVKRLAEINLVDHDTAGATKYLRMLEQTLFHKKWAQKRLSQIKKNESPRWLVEKQAQIATSDTIRQGQDYWKSVEFLVKSNPHNLVALDYLLCHYLLEKDIQSFKLTYDLYGKRVMRAVPRVYSEALLIDLFAKRVSQDVVFGYAISPQKIKEFTSYTHQFDQTHGELKKMSQSFGTTYWFYYHFATMKHE